MNKMNKKKKSFLLISVIVGIFLFMTMPAGASSSSDSLVSKSWVDQYVDSQFDKLDVKADELQQAITQCSKRHIVLYLGEQEAFINDVAYTMDVLPAVKNDFIMVPMRFISEALNVRVDWNNQTKVVVCQAQGTTVVLPLNANSATVNGKKVLLDCAPMAKSGRILVPTRFIAQAFGCTVNWDNSLKKVDIYS